MLETACREVAVLLDRRYLTIGRRTTFCGHPYHQLSELFPVLATLPTSVFSMMPLGRLVSKLLGLILKRLQKCQTFLEYMRSFQVWQQADTQSTPRPNFTYFPSQLDSLRSPQKSCCLYSPQMRFLPCKTGHEPERANKRNC